MMANEVGFELLKDTRQALVADVHVHEERPLRHVLAASAAVFPKRVKHQHVVAGRQVRVGDVRADESGPAGDHDAHASSFNSSLLVAVALRGTFPAAAPGRRSCPWGSGHTTPWIRCAPLGTLRERRVLRLACAYSCGAWAASRGCCTRPGRGRRKRLPACRLAASFL